MKLTKTNSVQLVVILSLLLSSSSTLFSQISRKALFLGNSYTSYNSLPELVHELAESVGDTLIFDSNTPGGYTLDQHSSNETSLGKIMEGDWDYVVMQEQSQRPITSPLQFSSGIWSLNNTISEYALCSVPMLYMTWGRKNGDASLCPFFPSTCTYESMDAALRMQYQEAAGDYYTEISPVSMVWNKLREENPDMELYQPDESHPSIHGTYAAACCFYTTIFKKDPTFITHNANLTAADAEIIRNTTKTVVFDNLETFNYQESPNSSFDYLAYGDNYIGFNATGLGTPEEYFWEFGDGITTENINPGHLFEDGTYTVSLTTITCNLEGMHTSTTDTIIEFCSHTPTVSAPETWLCSSDSIWTEPADSYQWLHNGTPIPDTTQYLPDHSLYNGAGLSVISTLDGCSEISHTYTSMVVSFPYYYSTSLLDELCEGNSGFFAILNDYGPFSGDELINWYNNGVLIPEASNNDTLFITEPGIYSLDITDPNSLCPNDVILSGDLSFICDDSYIPNQIDNIRWGIYPIPSSDKVTLDFGEDINFKEIFIYDAIGTLIKVIKTSSTFNLDVSEFSKGLYYVRINDRKYSVRKFIKE